MDNFSSLSLMLTTFIMCLYVTDGAITSWELDSSGTPTSGATVSFLATAAQDTSDTTTIFTVTATTDETTDNTITYAIGTQPNAGQFEVSAAGVVKLITGQSLDCETASSLEVEVVATDAGSSAGTATVTIEITDVNEFTPVFSTPSTIVKCVAADDKSAGGTAVYTVVATDDDCTENTIEYTIDSGNTNDDFGIGPSTGVITVAKPLDMSVTETYELVIYATDSDSSPKTGSVTVKVVVWDFNCNECSGAGTIAVSSLTVLVSLLFYVYQLA